MVLGDMPSKMQTEVEDVSIQELEETFVKKLEISKELGSETIHQSPGRLVVKDTEEWEGPMKYSSSQHYHHSVRNAIDLNQDLDPPQQEGTALTRSIPPQGN